VNATTKTAQIRLSRSSPAYWRVTFDNPPLNLMGPEFVLEFREIMTALETDEQVKVVALRSQPQNISLAGATRGPRAPRYSASYSGISSASSSRTATSSKPIAGRWSKRPGPLAD
jgi:hypothetical protein